MRPTTTTSHSSRSCHCLRVIPSPTLPHRHSQVILALPLAAGDFLAVNLFRRCSRRRLLLHQRQRCRLRTVQGYRGKRGRKLKEPLAMCSIVALALPRRRYFEKEKKPSFVERLLQALLFLVIFSLISDLVFYFILFLLNALRNTGLSGEVARCFDCVAHPWVLERSPLRPR